jgi:hypothetical protein
MSDPYMTLPLSEFEGLHARVREAESVAAWWQDSSVRENEARRRAESTLEIEHQAQRLLLEYLDIDWPPGEPFIGIVSDEIQSLRAELSAYTRP